MADIKKIIPILPRVAEAIIPPARSLGPLTERLLPAQSALSKLSAPVMEEGSAAPTVKGLRDAFQTAIDRHLSLSPDEQALNSQAAAEGVAKYVGKQGPKVKPLLTQNEKLMKAKEGYELDGENPLVLNDGKGVETTGVALSPALQVGDFNTCVNYGSCKKSCLGLTAGNYFQLGGGQDMDALLGPRLSSYDRTRAMLNDPESYAVHLYNEIGQAKSKADANGNHLGVRTNVLSDIPASVYKPIMEAHPDVGFYDYTKSTAKPVADNHYLTYSSTGVSQPKELTGLDEDIINPHSNWRLMRGILDRGGNVAMSFSNKLHMPESIFDHETGNTYPVLNGDLHDFRPIDAPGHIVGLKNKAANSTHANAAAGSSGFLVHYDPQIPMENGKQMRDADGNVVVGNKQVQIGVQPTAAEIKAHLASMGENAPAEQAPAGYAEGGAVGDPTDSYTLTLPSRAAAHVMEGDIRDTHLSNIDKIRAQALSAEGISDDQMAQFQADKPQPTPEEFQQHILSILNGPRVASPLPPSEIRLSPEQISQNAQNTALHKRVEDQIRAETMARTSPSMAQGADPGRAPIPIEAGFAAPVQGAQAAARGAASFIGSGLGIPDALRITTDYAQRALGNRTGPMPPEDLYMSKINQLIGNNVPGLKFTDDPRKQLVDTVGEIAGALNPRMVGAPLGAAARKIASMSRGLPPVYQSEAVQQLTAPQATGALGAIRQQLLTAPQQGGETVAKRYPAGMNPEAVQRIRQNLNDSLGGDVPTHGRYQQQMVNLARMIDEINSPTPVLDKLRKGKPQFTSLSPHGDIFNEQNIPRFPMKVGGAV